MTDDETPVVAAPEGLRARRRRETRRHLADVAARLFEQRGVAGTTVDDIAAVAGVSPRTFFRYAETKEGAVFLGEEDFEVVVSRTLDRLRAGLPLVAALEEGWRRIVDDFAASDRAEQERVLRVRRLIIAEPSLLALALALDVEHVDRLIAAIRSEPGSTVDELEARTAITAIATTLRLAFDEWARLTESGVEADVRALYARVRRDLARAFATP